MTVDRSAAPMVLLVALRSVGTAAFAAPHLAAKSFGLEPGAESSYIVRLFAARNFALIAGLLASKGKPRRLWWRLGVACDGLDALAGLLALRGGKPASSAMVDTSASLIAAGLGAGGLLLDRGR